MTRSCQPSDDRSKALFDRAQKVLVGGVNSPVRAYGAVGGTPRFVECAHGPHIFDVDGNRYIDLVGSWGPAILGHAHPEVVEAVRKAAGRGVSYGACCSAEVELAELILGALDSCDMIRFVCSGTEAVMSALRLARAATGRDRIIKFQGCYHGHADSLLVAAGSGAMTLAQPDSAGVPSELAALTLLAPYNDAEAVANLMKACGDEVAAVLVEPVAGNMGMILPEPGFLESLRTICDEHSALLIFDEVMTGFRVAWGGYQNTCSIQPDITCLGKVIGGGLPVAAFAGRRELMQLVSPVGPVYQAGTLSGNPLGMAAGLATLSCCREPGFYESLHERGTRVASGLRDAASECNVPVQTLALGGMLGLFFRDQSVRNDDDAKQADRNAYAQFFHAMIARRVWLPPSPFEALFLSAAHGDDEIDQILDAARASLREVRS